ncbi:Aste57867_16006 [Aphanomyces stellatus]|uniref:phosphoserine phosphatase n=1 Tax=Aphanomyces stellatus TaxID=120398 RepID=A0A485L5F1_9STRA|nr:hypothetical protein As57867_015950 [Aphanomyces stellatus]VFT92791.1 Aste57867_16006 [Aphanomyces stellatus]
MARTLLTSRVGIFSRGLHKMHASTLVRATWKRAQAVCFDVDSTVCCEEGIDVLAAHCGQGKRVAEWTTRAMNGGVKFEDALAARLDIIRPSRQDVEDCLRAHPPKLTTGIATLIKGLHARDIDVYFVSGGFRLMISPVASQLNVPEANIFANTIHFDAATGAYAGFDANEMTSRDGGKPRVLDMLKKKHGYDTIVMVGDGVTDMQAKPPADLFVGFGGVVERDIVKQHADWFVKDFMELRIGTAMATTVCSLKLFDVCHCSACQIVMSNASLPVPTLQCIQTLKTWSIRCQWEATDGVSAYTLDLYVCRTPKHESVVGTFDSFPVDPGVKAYTGVLSCEITPVHPHLTVVHGYILQLRGTTAMGETLMSPRTCLFRRIDSDLDAKDVVFAAQHAGMRSLHDLLMQYPFHPDVAARVAAAIVRTLHRPPDERNDSSSDDDDEYDHGALRDADVLSDVVDVLFRRMESFAGHVDLQRWGIRAGSLLLLPFVAAPTSAFAGLHSATTTFVQLVLKAMAKFAANSAVVLWGSQDLAALLVQQRQYVSVLAERGGIEVCVDAMRRHADNLSVQRWIGQVLLLCLFWDVRLQDAAKNEGLLLHCNTVLDQDSSAVGGGGPLVDILTCLRFMLEAIGKVHPGNSDLLLSRYDDGTTASIVSTEAVPNAVSGKQRHHAAITITRFFRYILSAKRTDMEAGSSFLAVIKAALAREHADNNASDGE